MDSLSAGVQSLNMAHPCTGKADASYDSKDSQGVMSNSEGTSLSVSDKESASIVERSVQLMPQPEIKQSEPITVLSVSQAVIRGDLKYIDEAYNKGFDFNIIDDAGKTLLDLAIEHNKTQIVAAFLGKYPHESFMHDQDILPPKSKLRNNSNPLINPGKPNGHKIYPLHTAVRHKNPDIVHLLGSFGDLNVSNRAETALHLAVRIQDEISVQILLSLGASLNVQDNNFKTPYMLSIRNTKSDSISIQEMLQNKPSDLNLKDRNGANVLMHSIIKGSKKTFDYLMEHADEIDLNAQDNSGDTVVHYAAKKGDYHYLKTLLNAQADGSIKNHLGRLPTCLVFDISTTNLVPNVKHNLLLLLNSYFNQHARFGPKMKLLSENVFLQDQSILANYLLAFDHRGETIFSLAFNFIEDHKKEVFYWLVSQVKPSLQDALGNSLYHYAVIGRRCKLIRRMLEIQNNPFLNMQNQLGETPLHIAARNNYHHITKALLPVSNVNCLDNQQRTAFMSALFHGSDASALFISKNPKRLDFSLKDIDGNTIIHLAVPNHSNFVLMNKILYAAQGLSSKDLNRQNKQGRSIQYALASLKAKVASMPQASTHYFTKSFDTVPSIAPDSKFTYCNQTDVKPLYPNPAQQSSRFVQPNGPVATGFPYASYVPPRFAPLVYVPGAPRDYLMRDPAGDPAGVLMMPPQRFSFQSQQPHLLQQSQFQPSQFQPPQFQPPQFQPPQFQPPHQQPHLLQQPQFQPPHLLQPPHQQQPQFQPPHLLQPPQQPHQQQPQFQPPQFQPNPLQQPYYVHEHSR